MKGQDKLIRIIKNIAQGEYSDEIMELTKAEYPEDIRDLAEAVGMMMVKIEAREFHLEQLNEKLRTNVLKTVTSMSNALAARDVYTQGHDIRVAAYAERLARRLGLDEEETRSIHIAGIIHDIGKIGFSDALFDNEDVRPKEELLAEIRMHPEWGMEILKDLDFLGPALNYMHCHHERMDGTGYPRGLSGEAIPMGARILSVADCFDAMTTDRPYQKGRTMDEAFAILDKLKAAHLDPALVDAFKDEVRENGMEESVSVYQGPPPSGAD